MNPSQRRAHLGLKTKGGGGLFLLLLLLLLLVLLILLLLLLLILLILLILLLLLLLFEQTRQATRLYEYVGQSSDGSMHMQQRRLTAPP